jgi:Tfp pilus assembly PilM family ATPase
MKGTERYLAFIIERSHITAVEVAHSPKGKTLTAAGSFDSTINFDDPQVQTEMGAGTRERTFVKEIQAFMKKIAAGAHFFSFGLNSKMAMVQSIPVEASLSDDEFATHLEWELQNFYPDANPEQFVISPYALVGDNGKPGDRAMVISVRKSFINFLSNVCDRMHGHLHIVDIDHFCAETCLTYSFPQLSTKRTVVIGMDEETLDASLLIAGKNADIRSLLWRGNDFSVIDAYAREQNADVIYLHGRMVNNKIADRVQQVTPIKVEISDPFKRIALPSSMNNVEEIKSKSQEYTAAVGLAVREEE